jgi:hypothetical protein
MLQLTLFLLLTNSFVGTVLAIRWFASFTSNERVGA